MSLAFIAKSIHCIIHRIIHNFEENSMAQLWGGRFKDNTDQEVYDFNASISFDKRLIDVDIAGSRAHVKMLAKQGILTGPGRY